MFNKNKENKKFRTVQVSAKTFDSIRCLSALSGKNKSCLLDEIFDSLIATGLTFNEGLNLQYIRYGNDVTVRFSGSSRLAFGVTDVSDCKNQKQADKKCFNEGKKALEKTIESRVND